MLSLLLGVSHAVVHAKSRTKTRNTSDNIKFGITLGATLSDLNYFTGRNTWSISNEYSKKVIALRSTPQARRGFHVNVFGSYKPFKYLDLLVSIEYLTKGHRPIRYIGEMERSQTGGLSRSECFDARAYETERYEEKLYFNYLQSNVQVNIFPGKDRQFFFIAGGFIGYLLTATRQTQHYVHHQKQGKPEIINFKEDTLTRDNLNNIDIGIALGLGYEFDLGLILSLNGSTGLRKIVEDNNMKWTNLGSQLSLGYNFAKLLK